MTWLISMREINPIFSFFLDASVKLKHSMTLRKETLRQQSMVCG